MKRLELTLLYLRNKDQVLLAMKKRGFGVGKWNGVGGKIELNESVEQALIRECQEEICVTPTIFEKSGELVFNEFHNGARTLMNLHIYTATSWKGVPTESEEMKPKWFSEQSMPYDDMWPADKEWLPLVLQGNYVSGEFTLRSDNSVASRNITSQ